MIILDRKISEVESELKRAEDGWRKTEAKGLRVMDAAGADVGWKAASGGNVVRLVSTLTGWAR